jgi:hypothetical protein
VSLEKALPFCFGVGYAGLADVAFPLRLAGCYPVMMVIMLMNSKGATLAGTRPFSFLES